MRKDATVAHVLNSILQQISLTDASLIDFDTTAGSNIPQIYAKAGTNLALLEYIKMDCCCQTSEFPGLLQQGFTACTSLKCFTMSNSISTVSFLNIVYILIIKVPPGSSKDIATSVSFRRSGKTLRSCCAGSSCRYGLSRSKLSKQTTQNKTFENLRKHNMRATFWILQYKDRKL